MEDLLICRVCLRTGVKLFNIFIPSNYNVVRAYENLTGIKSSKHPLLAYPRYICTYCKFLVVKSNRFRERCIQSQELFKRAAITLPELTIDHIQTLSSHRSPTHSLSTTGIETSILHPLPEIQIKQELDSPLKQEELSDQSDEEPLAKKVDKKKGSNYSEFGENSFEPEELVILGFEDNEKDATFPEFDIDKDTYETADCETNVPEPDDWLENQDIEVIFLSKEEQINEILARKGSMNYQNSFYKCELCFKGFMTDVTYKNHMMRHDPSSGPHTCEICHTRWPDNRSVKAHSATSHERRYICKLCTHTSKSCHHAKEHLKWHKGHKFNCKICGASFSKSTSHLTHVRLQHPSQFCCDVCGESFIGQNGLNIHKKKSHRGYQERKVALSCALCRTHFKTAEALQRHTSSSDAGVCDASLFACSHCGDAFSSDELLKDHQKSHQKGDSVKCDECNRTFAHERSFSLHYQRVHLGIKLSYPRKGGLRAPVVCEMCGKKCHSNATLIYHQRIHTGEKPFQCPQCPKKFSVYQRLQIHTRTHTGERPFACSRCPKAFKHKAALNRHDRVHTGAKPYECPHCSKSFSQSNSMKLHVRTVHLKLPAPYRRRNTKPE